MIPDPILGLLFIAAVAAALWGVKMYRDEVRLKW